MHTDDYRRATAWARRIYVVTACWPLRMVVVREVHAAWKPAHTLCNVCAGFHVTYIHEIGEEKKKIDTMHHLCVFVSQRGGGGGRLGRNDQFSF